MSERNLIVILGPTASGKSALGVKLAKKFHGVVISADSRQVYRGLDIGTAKITKQEMNDVPHYLLSVVSPKSQYSVAHYVRDVHRALKKINPSTPIFLVGGSPFYIKAITEPNSFSLVPPNPALRRRVEKNKTAQIIIIVKYKKFCRAKTKDQTKPRRRSRAIEIAQDSRQTTPLADLAAPPEFRRGEDAQRPGVVLKIGLLVPRKQLYARIDRRVDQRLQRGMISEVRKLRRQGLSWKRLDAFGLEYRWITKYLRGEITQPEMVQRLKGDIHDFTRRQLTWWKRDKNIHWVTLTTQAQTLAKKFLQS